MYSAFLPPASSPPLKDAAWIGGIEMGVYIPGISMPENCHDCPLCFFRRCLADGVDLTEKETRPHAERREACTLIPVPEHGDLIDRDELRKQEWVIDGMVHYFEPISIEEAPTIIPADFAKDINILSKEASDG